MKLTPLFVACFAVFSAGCGQPQTDNTASPPAELATAADVQPADDLGEEGLGLLTSSTTTSINDSDTACDTYSGLLLDFRVDDVVLDALADDFADADRMQLTDLRSALAEIDLGGARAWDELVELQSTTDQLNSDRWISLLAEIDRITFDACGLPLVSARLQSQVDRFSCVSSGADQECEDADQPTGWPCFVLADAPASSSAYVLSDDLDYYQAVGCETGSPVELVGAEWVETQTDSAPGFAPIDN